MYKRILLAYDGSREGIIALREGALLAHRCCSEVYLLSVVPETAGVTMAESVYGGVVAHQTDAYRTLLARGVEVLTRLGFKPVALLVSGEPIPQIAAFAKEIGADLVVVGQRRQGALERWWSGPSGASVIDHIKCSVLVGCNSISDEAFEAELAQREGVVGA
jgi:nucleotide-binding universal stress UspA family protein